MCFRGFKYQIFMEVQNKQKKIDKNIKDFLETNSLYNTIILTIN